MATTNPIRVVDGSLDVLPLNSGEGSAFEYAALACARIDSNNDVR